MLRLQDDPISNTRRPTARLPGSLPSIKRLLSRVQVNACVDDLPHAILEPHSSLDRIWWWLICNRRVLGANGPPIPTPASFNLVA
jgi:hypothetical protein